MNKEKGRVFPYGCGKTIVRMKLNELPNDIQKSIIQRYKKREGYLKITEDTVNIVLVCEDIFATDR